MGQKIKLDMVSQNHWGAEETVETPSFGGHLQDVHCIHIDDNFVATGSRDCAARVFDRSTGDTRFILGHPIRGGPLNKITGKCQDPVIGNKAPPEDGHSMDVNSVCLVTSRGLVYTAGEGFGTRDFMKAWDLRTGCLIKNMEGHMEGVFAITKSEELGLLFSASVDSTIRVWDMSTHECVRVLEEHTDKVRCLFWDAERRELLSGGSELLVWNADDWTVKHKFEGHKDWVTSVCVDGDMVVSTSVDKTCRIWDRDGTLQQTLQHQNWLNSACILDRSVVTACGDATIASWNIDTWEREWSFMAHREHNAVSTVLPVGDGRLFTASWDGSVKTWTPDQLLEQGAAAAEKEQAELAAKPEKEAEKPAGENIFGQPLAPLQTDTWSDVESEGKEGIIEGIMKDAKEADEPDSEPDSEGFVASSTFSGSQAGMVFQLGSKGMGYYPDKVQKEECQPEPEPEVVPEVVPEPDEVIEEFVTSGAKRSLIEELD